MKRIYKYLKDLPHIMKAEIAIAIMLTALIALSLPSLAWFSGSRKLGDLERIDTPTKLFITASERDDIKYLQLTDIKVSNSQEHKKYYVFCVSGESASNYHLQLAYTTNNQFEYFIYPAKKLDTQTSECLVTHINHDADGVETDTSYYAIEKDSSKNLPASPNAFTNNNTDNEYYRLWNGSKVRGSDPIVTRYLNKDGNCLIANDDMHTDTYNYKRYDDANANADLEDENAPAKGVGAQLYSEPIYWQALRIPSELDASNKFINYYILEVNWEKAAQAAASTGGLKDDRETDIIYIAAEAAS